MILVLTHRAILLVVVASDMPKYRNDQMIPKRFMVHISYWDYITLNYQNHHFCMFLLYSPV